MEDYGKAAATFVDTQTGRAMRVAPALDTREQAYACASEEPRHYFAQMEAYRIIPDRQLLRIAEVHLTTPIEEIVSRPGLRVNSAVCGEEIMNGRETQRDGLVVCRRVPERPTTINPFLFTVSS